MTDLMAWRDRYFDLIDQIVQLTLKGNIRSKEQVYELLVQNIGPGTGEMFERCLSDRSTTLQQQATDSSQEIKQAKATRSLRALQTIQGEWQRWQTVNQSQSTLAAVLQQIMAAPPAECLRALLQATDPNQPQPLTATQFHQLADRLQQQQVSDPARQTELHQMAAGIQQGLRSWGNLQVHLVSWIYDPAQIGFAGMPSGAGNPWALWAQQAIGALPKSLLQTIAEQHSVTDWAASQTPDLAAWVELAIVLRTLQQGLINWSDQLIYSAGSKLSISIFLSFIITWSQLANGFARATGLNPLHRDRYADGALQVTLQVLRIFAQQEYFPLYGSIFAAFSGGSLRDVGQYLDAPLRQAEGTQEKARILTLIGASQRVLGNFEQAQELHQLAQELAREAGDQRCEIANLNHLSRLCVTRKAYSEAINYSQRALILSRQVGDRPGEANALANLGYSEVLQAQFLEAEPEVYEMAIGYLNQGQLLAEKLDDHQSQALCAVSLGIAHLVLHQPEAALVDLETGLQAAEIAGDVYLQAISLAHLAEAFYQRQDYDRAIPTAGIALYKLEQMGASDWRQPAGLLTIMSGQQGSDPAVDLAAHRPEIISVIGIDGYDYCLELLKRYQEFT
jgi:tetratricopeptide (TPR) repeat protein